MPVETFGYEVLLLLPAEWLLPHDSAAEYNQKSLV